MAAIVCIPRLHAAFLPESVRDRVFFIPTSLQDDAVPAGTGSTDCADDPQERMRRALPFAPAEARRVLEEILRLGREHAPGGTLGQLAFLEAAGTGGGQERAGEFAVLEAFACSGNLPTAKLEDGAGAEASDAAARLRILRECQKLLLLAHALEESLLDAARLEGHFRDVERSLHAALGEGDLEELREVMPQEEAYGVDDPVPVPVPWRRIVDAALPFVPDDCLLFTADAAMALDLEDARLPLSALPEDRAEALALWPQEMLSRLSLVRLPGWRLAGRRACPAERPWLEGQRDVLVLHA